MPAPTSAQSTDADPVHMPIELEPYGVAISWDRLTKEVDVDLQAVLVNGKGQIVNAIYFNNLSCYRGAVHHAGDEATGEKVGYDEVIYTQLSRLPDVELIIFIVAAYAGGTLADIASGELVFFNKKGVQKKIPMEDVKTGVDPMVLFRRGRHDREWVFEEIDEFSEAGHHFMDILEPTLGTIIREKIPAAPQNQQLSFKVQMRKGTCAELPADWSTTGAVNIGLGWDLVAGCNGVDLDISAVFFGSVGKCLGAVYYDNKEQHGVTHSGNNTTGAGEGDDEKIAIHFGKVPDEVQQIFIIVNVKTMGMTLSSVLTAYCRVLGGSNEIARYNFIYGRRKTGMIMGRFLRHPCGRWAFQTTAHYCSGRTWMESKDSLTKISKTSEADFNSKYSGVGLVKQSKSMAFK